MATGSSSNLPRIDLIEFSNQLENVCDKLRPFADFRANRDYVIAFPENFISLESLISLTAQLSALSAEELNQLQPVLNEIKSLYKEIAKAKSILSQTSLADKNYQEVMFALQTIAYLADDLSPVPLPTPKEIVMPEILAAVQAKNAEPNADQAIIPEHSIVMHFYFKASTTGRQAGMLLPRHAYFELYTNAKERKSYEFKLENSAPDFLYNKVIGVSAPATARIFNSWEEDKRYKEAGYTHKKIVIPCDLACDLDGVKKLSFSDAKTLAQASYITKGGESAPRFKFHPISNNCSTQVFQALENAGAFNYLKKPDYIDTPLRLYRYGQKLEAVLNLRNKIYLLELEVEKDLVNANIKLATSAVLQSLKAELNNNMSSAKINQLTQVIDLTNKGLISNFTDEDISAYEKLIKQLPGHVSNPKKIVGAIGAFFFAVIATTLFIGAFACPVLAPFLIPLAIAAGVATLAILASVGLAFSGREKGVAKSFSTFFKEVASKQQFTEEKPEIRREVKASVGK